MQYKYLLFSFYLILCQFFCFSQTSNSFEGVIIDAETGDSIAFANIVSSNIGVYSNVDGFFRLTVNGAKSTDSIKISHIGYQSTYCLWDSVDSIRTYKLLLNPITHDLDEVLIKGQKIKENADDIVSRAIENLNRNVKRDPYILESFLKETHYFEYLSDNKKTYLKYQESALQLINENLNHYRPIVREIRRSNDYRESSGLTPYHRDDKEYQNYFTNDVLRLDHLWHYDIGVPRYETNQDLLSPSVGNLHNDFLNRHKFKLDKITKYDNQLVYVIKVLPTRRSITIENYLYIPIGLLYITGDNYSILEYQYSYIINPKKENSFNGRLHKTVSQGAVLFRDVIKYKELNGKIYLSYLMRDQGDPWFMGGAEGIKRNNLNDSSGYFRVRHELVVSQIIDDRINEHIATANYENVFPETYSYNSSFWKNYNTLLNSEEDKKLLRDLGNGLPIDEQFILNGQDPD